MRKKQLVISKLEEIDYLFKNLKYSINKLEPEAVNNYYNMIQSVLDEVLSHIESEDEK